MEGTAVRLALLQPDRWTGRTPPQPVELTDRSLSILDGMVTEPATSGAH
jgi:hypothetical protein